MTEDFKFDEGFYKRLKELYTLCGTREKIAKAIDYKPRQLINWANGDAKIPAVVAAQLCQMGGKSLDWLFFGERIEESPRDMDLDFLEEVIYHFETGIQKFDLELSDPKARSQLIPLMYQYCLETEDEDSRDIFQKNMFKVAK